jgi:hypothetical protein
MKYFSFSCITGEFVESRDARENPRQEGDFLLPANATFEAPPTTRENEVACWADDKWIKIADYRGVDVYDIFTCQKITILNIGSLPTNVTLVAPPENHEYYKFIDGEWELDITAAKAGTIAKLWQGATQYTDLQINAAEYAKTLNLPGNSKASENIAWYDAVWLDYYNRRALVESGDLDVSFDFSNNGAKPWKFWQVIQA